MASSGDGAPGYDHEQDAPMAGGEATGGEAPEHRGDDPYHESDAYAQGVDGEAGGGGGAPAGGYWGYGDGGDGGQDDDVGDSSDEESEDEDLDHELPDFASRETRALMEAVKQAEASTEKYESQAEQHKDRLQVMQEHLKNVRAELKQTQSLLSARRRAIEQEDRARALAEREIGRCRADLAELDARAEEVADAMASKQADIHRGLEKLEDFKAKSEMTQEQLQQWAAAASQKEDDALALARYAKADEGKIKELSLALEKLAQAVDARKKALEQAVTSTQGKQAELDSAAQDFYALHAEREKLLEQLAAAVRDIRRRDEAIAEQGRAYAAARQRVRDRREAVDRLAAAQARQEADNKEVELQTEQAGRDLGAQRLQLNRAQEMLQAAEDEAALQRAEVGKAAAELARRRTERDQLRESIGQSEEKLRAALAKEEAAGKRKAEAVKRASKLGKEADKRAVQLEEQKMALERLERECAQARERQFRFGEELAALRRQEEELAQGIAGAHSAGRNLQQELGKLDKEAARQAELVYAAEFQVQAMERKLARVSGHVSDEEKVRLEARQGELNEELKGAEGVKADLQLQLRRMEDEARRARRRQRELDESVAKARAAIAEVQLQARAGESALYAAAKERDEAQVEHDVVKLDVRRLRAALAAASDAVFGLENRSAQLQLSMQERRKEVEAQSQLQRAELRLAEEARHKAALDLREREAKVGALNRKYEAVRAKGLGAAAAAAGESVSEGKDGGGGGEPRSQAYFVIRAAQRREELQRQGDELNAAVEGAKREAAALRSTLKKLQKRNAVFRQSFRPADGTTQAEKAARLEQEAQEATDAVFRSKRALQRAAADIEAAKARATDASRREAALRGRSDELEARRRQAEEELEAARERARAAEEAVGEARAALVLAMEGGDDGSGGGAAGGHQEGKGQEEAEEVRAAGAGGLGTRGGPTAVEEAAVRAEALRANAAAVMFTLGQLAREFPAMRPALRYAAQRRGLRVPAKKPPRASTDVPAGAS